MARVFRLILTERARRQIRAIPSDFLRSEILDEIEMLLDDPYPIGSELEDELLHRCRLKINGWRVIYKVDTSDQVITVLTVRRRNRNTYLNIP